jgi:hypothetical protein
MMPIPVGHRVEVTYFVLESVSVGCSAPLGVDPSENADPTIVGDACDVAVEGRSRTVTLCGDAAHRGSANANANANALSLVPRWNTHQAAVRQASS